MGNEDNVRRLEIPIVEVRRVVPKFVKTFITDVYRKNLPKPVYNVRTRPKD